MTGYTALGTVTTATTIAKTWGDQVNTNFEAVKPRVLQPASFVNGGTAAATSIAHHPVISIGNATDNGYALWGFLIPTDFAVLTKAVVRIVSLQSGNVEYQLISNHCAVGVHYAANTYTGANILLAVTANLVTEIDVSAAFSGISAGDSFGIEFIRAGSSVTDTVTDVYLFPYPDVEYTP